MKSETFFSVGILNDEIFTQHQTGITHFESEKRVISIANRLKNAKLLTDVNSISPKLAKLEDLELAHSLDYIHLVEEEAGRCKEGELKMLSTGDVVICNRSYEVARFAVGGVLNAIDAVFSKRFTSAFCIVRPPGHHACRSIGMGFCLFNNVVIGTLYALKTYPISRVLIVDWDLHHGNGTEELVKNDPGIFYFSTHQSPLWPGTGDEEEKGCGNIINREILAGSSSRAALLNAYETTLTSAMEVFKPELVMISAGFDAYEYDPLGNLKLKAEDFGTLTTIVKRIADRFASGRIISVLEGGYHLEGLAESALAHVTSLNANPEE